MKNLVIVESPAKAKTIEKFLGADYIVKSCYGHIRDLAEKGISVDVNDRFKPKYTISDDKVKLVAELKSLAKDAEMIWLATDEDREGEAISWHLSEALGLNDSNTRRIVFHEITKPAILKAIENPRAIDKHLVDAQQARRILDRLVGFELSPVLWKKVKPSLSAGRVQSVAVRLIVEKEREINAFQSKATYKVTANFHPVNKDGSEDSAILKAELGNKFETKEEANAFLEKCIPAKFDISGIEVKPGTKSPAPPFTTSTLQQEASRKLGFSLVRTMQVAQKLYEAGHITYMRTDSLNLSEIAIDDMDKEIRAQYGDNYAQTRRYTTKSDSAQEAHEAIRPTYISNKNIEGDAQEIRLYDLIWKRTIASQMANAKLERTIVKINVSTSEFELTATGEVLLFDGFLKVYLESKDEEEDEDVKGMLPTLVEGQTLSLMDMDATERYSRPSSRYTEAALVKKLEELGIGRPSTYAPTITTIQTREYVVKTNSEGTERPYKVLTLKGGAIKESTLTEIVGKDKGKLAPSDIGLLVNDFLIANFGNILDYTFTARVEKEFDEIAEGRIVWQDMLGSFYTPFHQTVESTLLNTDYVKSERLIGVDPKSGKNVYARIGRFGPCVQIGEVSSEEGSVKPQYASLKKGQLIETITIEEALELFKLPREVGIFEELPMMVGLGRFGPYIGHNKKFYSLGKTDDPYTIEADRAIEIILAKRTDEANKFIKEFELDGENIQILNGRFGPYISYKKLFVTIPKSMDPLNITPAECKELIDAKIALGPGKSSGKKKKSK